MPNPPESIIAVDLGQVNDPTAIVVAERREEPTGRREDVTNLLAYWDGGDGSPPVVRVEQTAGVYDITHLERLPLGTPYTAIPARLASIAEAVARRWQRAVWERVERLPRLDAAPITLVVDQTGVGRPVVDLLREHGLAPVAVSIHGGERVIRAAADEWRVPKRVLVGSVQAVLQARRLRAAAGLAEWPTLRAELANFKAKISLGGHDRYEAGGGDDWRDGAHDDLVLAVALAVWWGEQAEAAGW